MRRLTDEERELLQWAEKADGHESHEVLGVKIRRLAILIKRILKAYEDKKC